LAWRCVDESFLSKIRSNWTGTKKGAWAKEFALSERQQQEPRRFFAAHFDEKNAATPADNPGQPCSRAIVWTNSAACLVLIFLKSYMVAAGVLKNPRNCTKNASAVKKGTRRFSACLWGC
jgi:hypothetical protein